jgi:hypothetical protein
MEAQEALLILMKFHGLRPLGKDLRVTGRRSLNKEYTIKERVGDSAKSMHILVLPLYFLGVTREYFFYHFWIILHH